MVAVCLLLVGMSIVVWSVVELSRLEDLNRLCDIRVGQTVEFLESCPYVEDYPFGSLQRFGIVLSSVGAVVLFLSVFSRFRMPISRTPRRLQPELSTRENRYNAEQSSGNQVGSRRVLKRSFGHICGSLSSVARHGLVLGRYG